MLDQLKAGDVLIGLHSSGVHSNGFSLVRKIVARSGLELSAPCPWSAEKDGSKPAATLGEALIAPTRIYVEALTPLFAEAKGLLALSHITGGGFTENIPRILAPGVGVEIDLASWQRPALFDWLQATGNVEPEEMARTFNNGIGMVLIVQQQEQQRILDLLSQAGERPVVMGTVVDREGVHYTNMNAWSAERFSRRLFHLLHCPCAKCKLKCEPKVDTTQLTACLALTDRGSEASLAHKPTTNTRRKVSDDQDKADKYDCYR